MLSFYEQLTGGITYSFQLLARLVVFGRSWSHRNFSTDRSSLKYAYATHAYAGGHVIPFSKPNEMPRDRTLQGLTRQMCWSRGTNFMSSYGMSLRRCLIWSRSTAYLSVKLRYHTVPKGSKPSSLRLRFLADDVLLMDVATNVRSE